MNLRLIRPVAFLRSFIQNVDYIYDDVAALRTKLAASIVDLGVLRTPTVALVTDVTEVRTKLAAAVVDLAAIRAAVVAITAKLDADGGVTDTNYAATTNPAALTATAPNAVTAVAPAALTASAPASLTSEAIAFVSG